MKRFALVALILMSLLIAALVAPLENSRASGSVVTPAHLTPYRQSWFDDFDSTTLDGRWQWVREDNSLWSLTAVVGKMRITSSGSLYQTINDQKNLLLTPAPAGDFRITASVQVTPTEDFHGAALYVYQDDDNYVELARLYDSGSRVRQRAEVAGSPSGSSVPVTANDILLRTVREGDVYYSWLSEDKGATWTFVDRVSATLANPKVGIGVRMGPTTTALMADFDWIQLETIDYNTHWQESFDGSTVDSSWEWVREDDNLWSLTAAPGMMQITGSGSLHQTGNNLKNLLLTAAPSGDFRITTRVQVSPTENFHGAALYVYQDDDNFIELARIYNNGASVGQRVELVGVPSGSYVSVTQDDILLRTVREGSVYYSWFSEDNGSIWNFVGQISTTLINPKVGISVRLGPTTTPLVAEFDFVSIEHNLERLYLPVVVR